MILFGGGCPAYDPVVMFKTLILQTLYTLSDDATEFQIRDRLSFMGFLRLGLEDPVPDAKTMRAVSRDGQRRTAKNLPRRSRTAFKGPSNRSRTDIFPPGHPFATYSPDFNPIGIANRNHSSAPGRSTRSKLRGRPSQTQSTRSKRTNTKTASPHAYMAHHEANALQLPVNR